MRRHESRLNRNDFYDFQEIESNEIAQEEWLERYREHRFCKLTDSKVERSVAVDGEEIDWTRPMLEGLKSAAKEHASGESKKDSFLFDGREFHTGYAKYLIEYLELKMRGDE